MKDLGVVRRGHPTGLQAVPELISRDVPGSEKEQCQQCHIGWLVHLLSGKVSQLVLRSEIECTR